MTFLLKVTLVTLVLSMSVAVNIPGTYLAALGIDPAPLKIALLVMILMGLIVYRPLALILFTTMITLGANMPEELAAALGINKSALLVTLFALVSIPLFLRWRRDTHLWEG